MRYTTVVIILCAQALLSAKPSAGASFLPSDDAFIKDYNRDGLADAINVYYNQPPYTVDLLSVRTHNNNPDNIVVGESRGIIEFTDVVVPSDANCQLELYIRQAPWSFRLVRIPSDGIVTLDDYGSTGETVLEASGNGLRLVLLDVTDYIDSGNNAFRFETPSYGDYGVVFAASEELSWSPQLIVVPEPATMSLLAIGGLALMRRRKQFRLR